MLKGNSHKKGCPVKLKDLRYINLSYINFQGERKIGELIVHKSIAKELIEIFKKLYESSYAIEKMQLVSNYNGDDFQSIEANNTSAYNCRFVEGTKRWSNHSYGKAIDINPLQNPFISKNGKIEHKYSIDFRKRVRTNPTSIQQKAMILEEDLIVKLFKQNGWRWGGDWVLIKDYQHFDKRN